MKSNSLSVLLFVLACSLALVQAGKIKYQEKQVSLARCCIYERMMIDMAILKVISTRRDPFAHGNHYTRRLLARQGGCIHPHKWYWSWFIVIEHIDGVDLTFKTETFEQETKQPGWIEVLVYYYQRAVDIGFHDPEGFVSSPLYVYNHITVNTNIFIQKSIILVALLV